MTRSGRQARQVGRTAARVMRARYLSGIPSRRAIAFRYGEYGRGFHRFWWELARADLPRTSPGTATAVILSHRRPFNIDLHVRAALLSRRVQRVVVSNNNPDVDLRDVVDVRHPRVVLRDDYGINANRRHLLANEYGGSAILAPDDDTFLRPQTMDELVARVEARGRSPLTTQGQLWDGSRWRGNVLAPPERYVDVANRVYAYTVAQAEMALDLARELELPPGSRAFAETPVDDVLLSFSGDAPALLVHAHFLNCATATDAQVSTYRQGGFTSIREATIQRLRQFRGWEPSSNRPGEPRD